MKKYMVFPLILGINLFALDIDSAVQKALENNFSLKEQQYIVEEKQESYNGSYNLYQPKLNVGYTYNDRNRLITGQIDKDSTLSATLSYNLFNGLSDMYTIEAYKDIFDASSFTYEAAKQDIILDVKVAYTNYLLARKNTQTNKEAYNLYTTQYKDTENFYKQGLIAKNELLEVEVQMLQAKQNLQGSISDESIALHQLENLLGTKIATSVEEIEYIDSELVSEKIMQLENRSEIRSLKEILNSLINQQKTIQGNFYPQLDATFGHYQYGDGVEVDGRLGYPDSQNVGTLALSWNLYNGGKDSSDKVVLQKQIKQVSMQIEDLKQKILLQYQTALEKYKLSKLNLQTATKSLESAKLNYEIVANKFKEGLSTNKDLIDANYLLVNAKENYFSSFYNRYISSATLQRILEK